MAKIARHTPTLTGEQKIGAVSLDTALFPHVSDAITELVNDWVWEEIGDSVQDIVDAMSVSVESWYSDMLIGSVSPWLVNPPNGWLLLDGSTHAGDDYPELFALLPAHLVGGANFTLPDVTDGFPQAVQDEDDSAVVTGTNVLNLTIGQLPAHTHDYVPVVPAADVGGAGVPLPSVAAGSAIATTSTGDGDDVDIRPKRFGLVYAVFAGRT